MMENRSFRVKIPDLCRLSNYSKALYRSNNRDCSLRAHLFLSYHLIQVSCSQHTFQGAIFKAWWYQFRVADPGDFIPDPTFQKNPYPDPTVKKNPGPYATIYWKQDQTLLWKPDPDPTVKKKPDPDPQPWISHAFKQSNPGRFFLEKTMTFFLIKLEKEKVTFLSTPLDEMILGPDHNSLI